MAVENIPKEPLFSSLSLKHGKAMQNRLALAPLTNTQSFEDGTLSADEYRWLTMRAAGGFGHVKTCAIAVEARGRGYSGQLGVWDDAHIDGLSRLAAGIKAEGTLSCAQLSHSGQRSLENRVGVIADDAENVTALSSNDVEIIIASFASGALRCEQAGFDGVEIHAAHGFLPAQFFSPEINTRDDQWGGSLENRTAFIRHILTKIRAQSGPDFQLGLRLSPERFGLRLAEVLCFAEAIMQSGLIDWLDMSLWDVFKQPEETEFAEKPLISWFTELDRGDCRLGVAGNVMSHASAELALEMGADYIDIGKAAILAHDFPKQIEANPDYVLPERPVSALFLQAQGLGPAFINYMSGFGNFVQ